MKKEKRTLPMLFKNTALHTSRELLSGASSLSPTSLQLGSLTQRSQKDESFHNVFEDSFEKPSSPPLVGASARLEFFNYYKNIFRLSEKQKLNKEEKSASLAYLNSLVKCKLKPRAFGIIKNSGLESNIDIRMLSMGDSYAAPFAQGIKHYPLLQTLNLKNNRLTDKGNEKILRTLDCKQVQRLNLSENKLGVLSVQRIIEIISTFECRLKYLNLEKTLIGDGLLINLINVVTFNKRLTKLILANNNLSDRIAKSLKNLLISNNTLKVLDLHWNLFRAEGAIEIFEGLSKNNSLLILDISWNSIGRNIEAAETIGNCLKQNSSLLHLDLSYNCLDEKDSKILSELIKSNHTLLGIHVLGNKCSIDPKGFLMVDKKTKVHKSLFSRRIVEKQSHFHDVKTNCWICEKWVEQTFTCKSSGKSVFIHFEFEKFKPELMFNLQGDLHEIVRVVPPGLVKFFFTELDNFRIESCYEKAAQVVEVEVSLYEGMTKQLSVNTVELVCAFGEVCNIKAPFFTKPRTLENKYIPPAEKLERIKWLFKTSIFKDYFTDNEKLLSDCFEFDWKHSKISNFIRGQEDQDSLRKVLKENYSLLKQSYKILSAYSGNEIFSIGSNILNDFLNQCKIYDSLYQSSDFGVNLNSTLVQKEKNQLFNPGNSLVRYEFLEILVRISMDRYMRGKISSTIAQAMQKLLTDHLLPVIQEYKTDSWRSQEYFTEEVDLLLKANKEIFMNVFKRYSGKHTLPGKKPFMSVEEFRQLCQDVGLVGDNFATREIDVCFAQSIMTQVDEIYCKRHLEMNFFEFLEAICRAVDMSGGFESAGVKINSVAQSRLSLKIEVFLVWLLKVCPQSFQDEYVFPDHEVYMRMMYRFVPGR
jgi:hypothetical protein